MAEKTKLPVIGPVDRRWIYAGGALIAGIVGYAWWTRRQTPAPTGEVLPEDIPQGREPPPTIVGSEDFDTGEVRAIINTNPEWYTAAIDYLVTTGGFDFTFAAVTLGKFLARRQLTEQEANLVQAAKGAVGEPPQGGPWPIIRSAPPTASQPPVFTRATATWQGTRLTTTRTWISIATQYAHSKTPTGIESTKRAILEKNPSLAAKYGTRNTSRIPAGSIVLIPVWKATAA